MCQKKERDANVTVAIVIVFQKCLALNVPPMQVYFYLTKANPFEFQLLYKIVFENLIKMIQLVCKTDADCKVNGTSAIEGATCVECVCMSEMAGTCGEDSGNFIFLYLNQVFFIKFLILHASVRPYNNFIGTNLF